MPTSACPCQLALLELRQRWDRLLLITPFEALTRQHAEQLRGLWHWSVFAYPLDGDASTLRHLPPDTVILLDINNSNSHFATALAPTLQRGNENPLNRMLTAHESKELPSFGWVWGNPLAAPSQNENCWRARRDWSKLI